MPYNPSTNIYQLPAIYLAVPGTVIIAAQHNTPLEDLATANNYARPVIAGGTGANNITSAATNLEVVSYGAIQVLSDAEKAQARTNIGAGGGAPYAEKSGAYTVVAADDGAAIQFTTSATASFDPVADLGDGFRVSIWAPFGVTVTLEPDGSETINGDDTLVLQPGEKADIFSDGTNLVAKVTNDSLVGPQLQGYTYGLALTTNGTDAANDIDIAAGAAGSDASPFYLLQLASALTKQTDAAWAVGTNQGSLDTGSVSNAIYYIWLIQRSDTLVTDVLTSLSSTAPTMPANYDRKHLLGFFVRSASSNGPPSPMSLTPSQVRLNTANGHGSTGTRIRRFLNVVANEGSDITYADSASLGASFTINNSGIYSIMYVDSYSGTAARGISRNASSLTTNINSLSIGEVLSMGQTQTQYGFPVTWVGFLQGGDVIRAHDDGGSTGSTTNQQQFYIARVK